MPAARPGAMRPPLVAEPDLPTHDNLRAAEHHREDVARARCRWIREQGMLDPIVARLRCQCIGNGIAVRHCSQPFSTTSTLNGHELIAALNPSQAAGGGRDSGKRRSRTPSPRRPEPQSCGGVAALTVDSPTHASTRATASRCHSALRHAGQGGLGPQQAERAGKPRHRHDRVRISPAGKVSFARLLLRAPGRAMVAAGKKSPGSSARRSSARGQG
jgi:hypothetical protein